ncbi:MAG: translation initiation factor IF-3 [Candidatus Levyibacteriota bacterium]
MIKRYHKRQGQVSVQYRINERVWAASLRVLDNEGKQVGVLSRADALAKAKEAGLDLVEIAPNASPPVAKIIDYKKFLYQIAKKQREEKRNTKVTETKEVRLGPFMNDHDLNVMIQRARGFLEDSDKVRLVLKFSGRQVTHPEFGYEIIRKVTTALNDISKLEKEPRLEGKQLIAIISPERKKQTNAKEENKEISE